MFAINYRNTLVLILLVFFFLAAACDYRDRYAGLYVSGSPDLETPENVVLELKPNGEGLWRAGGDEVPFAWSVKGGELRIHTRGGGVITGALDGETIDITLPGTMKMLFRKVPGSDQVN